MTDRLVKMLDEQRDMQDRYGYNFESMTVDQRVAFIKDMYIAAVRELGEALDETTWKPWTHGVRSSIHQTAMVSELSDAFQFIMNMWFAVFPDRTPEQLADMMLAKLQKKLTINEVRRVEGYDGVSTKCPKCRRALDDPAVECDAKSTYLSRGDTDVVGAWCAVYGVYKP